MKRTRARPTERARPGGPSSMRAAAIEPFALERSSSRTQRSFRDLTRNRQLAPAPSASSARDASERHVLARVGRRALQAELGHQRDIALDLRDCRS